MRGGIILLNSGGNLALDTWFQHSPPPIHDPDGDGYGFIEFAEGDITNSVGFRVAGVAADQGLPEGHEIWAYLRWEDTWPGASTDLDLYLIDSASGEIVDKEEDVQLGGAGDYPTESLYFVIPEDGEYHIQVGYRSGNLPGWIQLTVPKAGYLEHSTEGYSINGPSESANPGMLAVGATHYWDTQTIAEYSSRGPTVDGRVKPDIVGTACGQVASYEPHTRNGFSCWFGGTSQAAPNVAGLAALVRQRFPTYSPVQVAGYLKDNAAQRESPDPNNTWGHGFAQMPAPLPPAAPTITTPITTGADWMTVTWEASNDNGREAVTSFDLRYIHASADDTVDSNWTLSESVGALSSRQHAVTGLTAATPYKIQVRGLNIWGAGVWSSTAIGTTAQPVVPGAPQSLTAAVAVDEARVDLSWTAPISSGGAPILGYKIESSDDGGDPWVEVYTTTGAATSYTDDGTDGNGPMFAAGEWSHYRVAAANSVGIGPFSEPRYAGGDPLVARYDANGDGEISRSEVIAAIRDYLDGVEGLTRADVIRLIRLYLDG